MKNLYFTLVFISLISSAQAQKISFTDTSNKWRIAQADWGYYTIINYSFKNTIVSIGGFDYQLLVSNQHDSILIRTDSSKQKVYAKVYRGSIQGAGRQYLDTNEHLLYDFSLQVGDTFKYKTFAHYVQKIDSTQIGGVWHKVFTLKGKNQTSPSFDNIYTVIEGVGCTKGLIYPLGPADFEGSLMLSCFQTNNSQPQTNPKVDFFDNNTSCYLSVEEQNHVQKEVQLYPQPASTVVNIQLPSKIQSGSLTMYNPLGQVVISRSIANSELWEIHNPGNMHGMYYYRISDNTENKIYSGKILFE